MTELFMPSPMNHGTVSLVSQFNGLTQDDDINFKLTTDTEILWLIRWLDLLQMRSVTVFYLHVL